jgi:hypothetical protein
MATVISIYDDNTGQHIRTFMVQAKPKRRWFYIEAAPFGLVLLCLLEAWL